VPPPSIDLDDVVVAWAQILPGLPPATKAAAQEAQPISVKDGVITFGVSRRSFEAARPRFKKEADTIRAALSERLGGTMKFQLEPHDGFDAAPTVARGAPDSDATSRLGEAPPDVDDADDADGADEALDPSELVDAPDAPDAAVDSVSKFTQSFDATVVEEVPRD
jgi:hypothetical protein